MGSTPVVLVVVLAVLAAPGAAGIMRARRRAAEVTERRQAALARVAASLEQVAAEFEAAPSQGLDMPSLQVVSTASASPPDPTTGLPTRAALVDALVAHVEEARISDGRLGLALVSVGGQGLGEAAVANVAAAIPGAAADAEAFRVGEHALALVLPGEGRAATIAAVARLEAGFREGPKLSAVVIELEPGEDAAEFLTRAVLEARGGELHQRH